MSAVPALLAGGIAAGVALVMSALFETSDLGSGVGWPRKRCEGNENCRQNDETSQFHAGRLNDDFRNVEMLV